MKTLHSFRLGMASLALATASLTVGCGGVPDDPVAAAEYALENGDPKAALMYLSEAIRSAPDDLELRMKAAEIALSLSNTDRAIAELKQIPGSSPLNAKAQGLIAEAYLIDGNFRMTSETLDGLTLDTPEAFRAAVGLDYAQGNFAEGDEKLSLALSQFAQDDRLKTIDGERLFRNGKPDTAMARIAIVLEQKPIVPEAHMLAGQISLGDGNLAKASEHFKNVVAVRPNHQTAMLAMAAIARDSGDTKAAEEWIGRATNAGPVHPVALYFAAQMAYDAGEIGSANDMLQSMPSSFKSMPEVQRLEGMVAANRGNTQVAIDTLQRYVNRSGGDWVARMVLAKNLAKNSEYTEAWSVIQPVVDNPAADGASLTLALDIASKASPGDSARIKARLSQQKGRVAMAPDLREAGAAIRAGDWQKADSIYDKLVRGAGGSDAVVLNNAAAVKSQLGEHDDAIALARKALSIEPNSAKILDTLGWSLWQAKTSVEEARQLLTRARELAPDDQTIYGHWAEAHAT